MKKLLLFASLGFFALTANAQTNISNDTLRLEFIQTADVNLDNAWHLDIKNPSHKAVNFKIKKIIASGDTTTGHSLFFCEEANCYGKGTYESPAQRTVAANGTFSFTAYFDPMDIIGASKVKYEIYNVDVPAEKVYVFFKYNAKASPATNPTTSFYVNLDFPSSVNDLQNNDHAILLAPNPANSYLSVDLNLVNNGKTNVAVYNLLGSKVIEKLNVNSSEKIDISTENLNNGVYYLKIEQDNKIISTKKFVVAH